MVLQKPYRLYRRPLSRDDTVQKYYQVWRRWSSHLPADIRCTLQSGCWCQHQAYRNGRLSAHYPRWKAYGVYDFGYTGQLQAVDYQRNQWRRHYRTPQRYLVRTVLEDLQHGEVGCVRYIEEYQRLQRGRIDVGCANCWCPNNHWRGREQLS